MKRASPTGSGSRLGTQLRGRLAAAYAQRGKAHGDLVLHYSFKCRADVALAAELELLHFLHAESDSGIESITYNPTEEVKRLAGHEYANLFHAAITMKDGARVWRRLVPQLPDNAECAKSLAAIAASGILKDITKVETLPRDLLVANPVRLRNALRAVSWIAAAKHWPLVEQKKRVLGMIRQRPMTFEAVLSIAEGAHQALYGAAVLELALSGSVMHDLFQQPLTAVTKFWAQVS